MEDSLSESRSIPKNKNSYCSAVMKKRKIFQRLEFEEEKLVAPSTWSQNDNEKLPVLQGKTWKRVHYSKAEKTAVVQEDSCKNSTTGEESSSKKSTPAASKKDNLASLSLEDIQLKIGSWSSDILEAPETHMDKIKSIVAWVRHDSSMIRSLAVVSLVAIFMDLIPSYKIRPLTELEQKEKTTKEVRALRNYEQGLLASYQSFLKTLDDSSPICIQALCSLLLKLTHFNFRKNLLSTVAKHCFSPNLNVARKCCSTLGQLFENDESGEVSFEAMQILSSSFKQNFSTSGIMKQYIGVMETLTHLRLREEFQKVADDASNSSNKNKKNRQTHVSKRSKKLLKEQKEVEKELKEAEATVSAEEKHRWYKETLKLLFTVYFRILKKMPESPLLVPTLEGLSRFSHLIDISIFYDLMNCLKAITSNSNITVHPLSIFHIIHTVSNLSVIHGAALMDLDLRYFHCLFYQTLLKMSKLDFLKKYFMESNGKKITELVIRNCHLLFWKRGESSVNRLASYCHALASMSASINELVKGCNGNIASDLDACSRNIIHILLSLIERQPKLSILLADSDEEATFGSFAYSTAVNDPDLTNGFGKTLNLCLPSKSSSEWMSLASKVRKIIE